METPGANPASPVILLAGGSGYVGGRLLHLLEKQPVKLRCLARIPEKMRSLVQLDTQIVRGDVLNPASLDSALQGVQTAYYLVHLMSGSKNFTKMDRQAAANFAGAATKPGVRRIIYLGGLGNDKEPNLSPHLRSRHEVGKILRESGVETIEFRASLVVGTGSLSFDLIKSLADRLPIMICPRWLSTATQPIAVDDVLAYLLAANDLPPGESCIFEIGSTDVTTYGNMIREYARQKGLRRWLISVPVLTPYLSSLWLALVTPTAFEVGQHLIEGLKNATVVRDTKALARFSIRWGFGRRSRRPWPWTKPDRRDGCKLSAQRTRKDGHGPSLADADAAPELTVVTVPPCPVKKCWLMTNLVRKSTGMQGPVPVEPG